ncbi:Ank3 [Symbiodinium sp. CCMP2592]|nr:Ank3 [Symbiodinium sp. CCMP2592]
MRCSEVQLDATPHPRTEEGLLFEVVVVDLEFVQEALAVWVEDAVQYHDLNRDKKVSLEELSYNFLHWSIVQARANSVRRLNGQKKSKAWAQEMIKQEQAYLGKYFCEDPAACPILKELESYGQQLLSSPKAAQAVYRKVRGMMEGEEGDEVINMVSRDSGKQEAVRASELRRSEL